MTWRQRFTAFTRRDLFRAGGWLASLNLLPGRRAAAAPAAAGPGIYRSIGVRPLINCTGAYTIVSGSQTLPRVKRAMDAASRHYVHMDELMDAVGKRLAELTGAEWGIVTAGCAAALTHATAACIAGADPEKMQRLPDLAGLKNEVVIPRYSRNVYDHAIRMLGVRIVEVDTPGELTAALNPRTAMIMILAGPGDEGPLGTEAVSRLAGPMGVPLIVDAAAEHLTVPNIHLRRGAAMVAYSGGKCIRGPQCAGLLLGRKDLLQAAWLNSAPHHAFGRSMKVGKEEIMGMLAAVEEWVKRDHDAEWKRFEAWLAYIAREVSQAPTVRTEVLQPPGLSNRTPRLLIAWDAARVGITGEEVRKLLFETDPRIVFWPERRPPGESSVVIFPQMMVTGDEKVVAERLRAVLSRPPRIPKPAPEPGQPASIAGQWDVRLEFVLGSAGHSLFLEQDGGSLSGTHRGGVLSGDLRGGVAGSEVHFSSSHRHEGTRLSYVFRGRVENDRMSGTVDLGEYGKARWTAERHRYAVSGGRRSGV
ncbi:MAG: hypothetical protein IT158_23680 [Bryobacterales bacterium]|nr:hypothetical protein [Bryobacterales bacterium]